FLLSPTTAVHPANIDPDALRLLTEHNSWVVRGADRGVYLKWRAVAYVLKQNPLLAPLGWLTDLPSLRAPLARLYHFVDAHRQGLAPIARRILPFRKERPIGAGAEIVCGVLMWLALICNVLSLPWPGKERLSAVVVSSKPAGRSQVFEALQIGQSWSLFAPTPTNRQRRYLVSATTMDGIRVDLMACARDPLFWLSNGYRVSFVTHRWMSYFDKLNALTKEQWAALGGYLCQWAGRPQAGLLMPVREVEIVEFDLSVDAVWTEAGNPTLRQAHACTRAIP